MRVLVVDMRREGLGADDYACGISTLACWEASIQGTGRSRERRCMYVPLGASQGEERCH